MSSGLQAIEIYLAAQDEQKRAGLELIREWIRGSCPQGEEKISYGMPAFYYMGKYLTGYAAFKSHFGIFPTPGPLDAMNPKWAHYRTSKGTLRLALDEPLPEDLVHEVVRLRMGEIAKQSS